MALMYPFNVDPSTYMETGSALELYPPLSRFVCPANIMSKGTLDWYYQDMIARGAFVPDVMTVQTGGGRPIMDDAGEYVLDDEGNVRRERWPDQPMGVVKVANLTCRSARKTLPDGTEEWASAETRALIAFYVDRRLNPREGDPSPDQYRLDPESIHINCTDILWRRNHPIDSEQYRMVPNSIEHSHAAESYERAFKATPALAPMQWSDNYRLYGMKPTSMEGDTPFDSNVAGWVEAPFINGSRRMCTATLAMWRKADTGEIIPLDDKDTYTGPTLCWHAAFGAPCYGPHPNECELEPRGATGQTPNKRKGGGPSGGGGDDRAKPGRKPSSVPTKRKLANEEVSAAMINRGVAAGSKE